MVDKSSVTTNKVCKILGYYLTCGKCAYARQCMKGTRYWERGAKGLCGKPYDNADMLFGDYEQCRYIMNKNFMGKPFMIPSMAGRNQP